MTNEIIWIKNEFLSWDLSWESKNHSDSDELSRSYQIWSHAESLLNSFESEFHLVDAISTLKRCLNQRLKFIEYVYELKKVKSDSSPKGYLEHLATFNLVRPALLKKLMTIRNDIEHNDAKPPSIDTCKELLDFTWYFLKSTDGILQGRVDSMIYEQCNTQNNERSYWCTVEVDFESEHKIKLCGWFPSSSTSKSPQENYLKLLLYDSKSKGEMDVSSDIHQDKLDSDLWIRGELQLTNELKHYVIKQLLEL